MASSKRRRFHPSWFQYARRGDETRWNNGCAGWRIGVTVAVAAHQPLPGGPSRDDPERSTGSPVVADGNAALRARDRDDLRERLIGIALRVVPADELDPVRALRARGDR